MQFLDNSSAASLHKAKYAGDFLSMQNVLVYTVTRVNAHQSFEPRVFF